MAKTETKRKAPARLPKQVESAIAAALDKKAADVMVLDLRKAGGFTDFFVICSGQNARQIKAIADAIQEQLRTQKVKPAHVEGYDRAEWVLLDYFDFIVHVFTREMRAFYGLERLWGTAARIPIADPAAGLAAAESAGGGAGGEQRRRRSAESAEVAERRARRRTTPRRPLRSAPLRGCAFGALPHAGISQTESRVFADRLSFVCCRHFSPASRAPLRGRAFGVRRPEAHVAFPSSLAPMFLALRHFHSCAPFDTSFDELPSTLPSMTRAAGQADMMTATEKTSALTKAGAFVFSGAVVVKVRPRTIAPAGEPDGHPCRELSRCLRPSALP